MPLKIIGHIKGGTSPCITLTKNKITAHLIIDTGFDGELCLNRKILSAWGFELKGTQEVELADGSIVESKVYIGFIPWFRGKRRVIANETKSSECLLGTGLLWGIEIQIDIARHKVLLQWHP